MTIYVGQHVERVEDLRLLRGRGTFVDDIAREGMLYAAVLRSPVAHGRLVRIDAAPAKALADVVAVFTAADFRALPLIPLRLAPIAGVERFLQRAIADAKVRYVGEPVAVVVAVSPEIAEDALELIDVEIEPLPAVIDWEGACGTSLLFEEHGTNVAARYQVGMGDADAAFAKADYRRKETFRCHRHTALPMETRGLVADWDAARARLTIWGMTKVPWFNRRALAEALALSPEQVDLVGTDIGGSFGVRGEIYPEDFLIPHVARTLARPVKWIEDRREHLMATNHSREIDCVLEIACARDGTILGLRGEVYANMGAYTRTNGGVVPAKVAQFLPGPYRIPNLAFDTAIFMTNKTPVGTYRAPGRFEANFFRERLLDLAAADLGIDPAAFRHKNLIREEELPYSLGQLVPYEKGTSIDTADCPAGFARVLEEIDYDRLRGLNGTMVDGRLQGVGLACFIESSGGGLKENARMLVEPDGTVTIHPGSSASGQGHETVFAQIAAERLGVQLDRIRVERASTANLEEGFGTFASRSAVKGGNAVLDGAEKLEQALLRLAGEVIGRAANDLAWQDGAAVTADGSVRLDLPTLAREAARRGRELDVIGTFSNTQLTYTYGAHAAHVAVDARTGHVEVLDYVALEDVGKALNPLIIHGQLIGAVVQGLGGAFLDHLVYDAEGQLLTGSLADYLVPTASDFPNVRGVTLENKLSPSNPLGVKGGGEGGLVCVAATVANAVGAALAPAGVTVTQLPLSPPLLWQSIQEAQSRSGAS
jgi:carbon-monoxide dehydrogenase large subunit